MRKFWKWTNQKIRNQDTGEETTERVLEFYGTIAEDSWFDDDITPAMFKKELLAGCAEIGRASCREECRSRWSPYH